MSPSSPPLGRRARQRQRRRQAIAAAAWALFHARGFDAVTTDEIAAKADVAKGTLFNYAPTKDHLLLLIYERKLSSAVDVGLQALDPEGPIPEGLLALFQGFFAAYEEDLALAQRFLRFQLFQNPEQGEGMNDLTLRFLTELSACLGRWQAQGRIDPLADVALGAQCIFMLYIGALQGWLGGYLGGGPERDAHLLQSLKLFYGGLAPRGGS